MPPRRHSRCSRESRPCSYCFLGGQTSENPSAAQPQRATCSAWGRTIRMLVVLICFSVRDIVLRRLCLGRHLLPCRLHEHPNLFGALVSSGIWMNYKQPLGLCALRGACGNSPPPPPHPPAFTAKPLHVLPVTTHFYSNLLWLFTKL